MRRRPTPLTALVGLALSASVLPALTLAPASAVAPAESAALVDESAPPPLAGISAVQGSGATSPREGERLTVEAVVTTLKTRNDAVVSYFLQEQDADADATPDTSEGLLVSCGSQCPTGLAAGDLVRATGTVQEMFGMTRLDASAPDTGSSVVTGTAATPTAAPVTLPATTSTTAPATFENVEGMRTTIPGVLAVSEYFNLARFGELVLTSGGRPYQFTHLNEPSEPGNAAYLAELATRRIVLDDGSEDQNDATSGPLSNEPYPYPSGGLSLDNRFRGGDTITGLTGVMEYGFGCWRIQPVPAQDYTFAEVNPRTAAPDEVGGSLKVASFNVLNYFADIDSTSSNSSGSCGPAGTADCRGADSEAERERQLAKIVAALTAIDADVVGLIEIQNDAGAATAQIVEALNAATAPGTYDYIRTGAIGTDAIKQAFLYRPATVRPVGDFATLTSAQDPRFVDTRNRPALLQTFAERRGANRVTVAVNHFKSKGSGCGAGDDTTDGSGNCDGTRTAAAQALADYLATDPTGSRDPDVLVIGDLNSYRMERPITTLEDAGYTDLVERFGGDKAYGYVFDGQLGYLDHALANPSLDSQVTGATEWHLNADEPTLLDYNDTVLDAGEASFERESAAPPLSAPDAYRSSDHDAVVVGLELTRPRRGVQPGVAGADPLVAGARRSLRPDGVRHGPCAEHRRSGKHGGERQRRGQQQAAEQAGHGDRRRVAALLTPQRQRAGVGHRVVDEHREAGEADRPAQVDHQHQRDDDGGDGQLGVVRHPVHRVDGGQPARQLALAGHREGRPAHPDQQRQQDAERGDGATDAYGRGQCGP